MSVAYLVRLGKVRQTRSETLGGIRLALPLEYRCCEGQWQIYNRAALLLGGIELTAWIAPSPITNS